MSELYRQENQQDRSVIERMTANRYWDSSDFGQILVALAKTSSSIPGPNRPESIHLQAWRPFIDRMWNHTKATGDECGRVVLADTGSDKIVMGKVTSGDPTSVSILPHKQPGREAVQVPIAMIHSHPDGANLGHGFSDADYISLMANASVQATLVRYGDKKALMALKTSVTPRLSQEQAKERVTSTIREFMTRASNPGIALSRFNMTLCVELGLTLYHQTPGSGDMFNRINVTEAI